MLLQDRIIVSNLYYFSQEIDLGLAADLGTLQRLPKVIGNGSLMRELAYTGREFRADEAKEFGMVR